MDRLSDSIEEQIDQMDTSTIDHALRERAKQHRGTQLDLLFESLLFLKDLAVRFPQVIDRRHAELVGALQYKLFHQESVDYVYLDVAERRAREIAAEKEKLILAMTSDEGSIKPKWPPEWGTPIAKEAGGPIEFISPEELMESLGGTVADKAEIEVTIKPHDWDPTAFSEVDRWERTSLDEAVPRNAVEAEMINTAKRITQEAIETTNKNIEEYKKRKEEEADANLSPRDYFIKKMGG